MSSRFVEVPTKDLEAMMTEIRTAVVKVGGVGRWTIVGKERVFEIVLPMHTPPMDRAFRVYTSIAVGQSHARDVGKDAVRIVVGTFVDDVFRPVMKSTKILRTAPQNMSHPERVASFLDRLKRAMREAYAKAARIEVCECGAAMALRTGKNGDFLGCVRYPDCNKTRSL